MSEFDQYLDLYRVGDAVQRSVGAMRVGPEDGFFNVPFPLPYTGLSGLGAAGQPLPRPFLTTLADGFVAPPATWLQTALNALVAATPQTSRAFGFTPVAVDGIAGPRTLAPVVTLWDAGVTERRFAAGPQPYLVTVGSSRTVAMPRALVNWITSLNLIEVAPPRQTITVTPGPVELDPIPPAPSATGGGALLLVAAAVAAGVYFSRR